jgi:IS605 OrfB family transposase
MPFLTYKFKLKNRKQELRILAGKVNRVWNYCNDTSYKAIKEQHRFLSGFDLNKLTTGTSETLKINAKTVQSICGQFAKSRNQFKKAKLKFRKSLGTSRSLGWVPFDYQNVKVVENAVFYNKLKFKFKKHREILGIIKTGAFVEDSCGDWYVTLTCEVEDLPHAHPKQEVGIDLGLKSLVTTSDAQVFPNPKLTNKNADKLATAQRYNSKVKIARIHRKIARQRHDNLHKLSNELTKTYKHIYVGDLKLPNSKQSNDASYRSLIPLLKYKASRLGGEVSLVNEAYSTVTCSFCLERSGPTGLKGLSVREWICDNCGQSHDRDVNGAKNILRFGHEPPKTANSSLELVRGIVKNQPVP